MEEERVIKINVSLYPSDLAEIDTLANIYYHGNRSLALRMIIDWWRENRIPSPQPSEQLENLIEGFLSEQVSPKEFSEAAQTLILAGGK